MKKRGQSYEKRVADINRIYDEWAKSGLPNRVIWRRYIYPVFGVSERTFYNILKASSKKPSNDDLYHQGFLFFDFFSKEDEQRHSDYYKKNS